MSDAETLADQALKHKQEEPDCTKVGCLLCGILGHADVTTRMVEGAKDDAYKAGMVAGLNRALGIVEAWQGSGQVINEITKSIKGYITLVESGDVGRRFRGI